MSYTYTDGNNCSTTATRQIQVIQGADNQAPSVPQNLLASNIGESSLTLSWNASSDNIGVVGYYVYQDGNTTPVATVSGTSTSINNLTPGTTYQFSVAAYDAAGNVSAQSQAIQVTTEVPAGTCSNPENLALGETASQSSTYGIGEASYAVDGNTSGTSPWTADLQHTRNESQPWWEVDLGQLSEIETVPTLQPYQ